STKNEKIDPDSYLRGLTAGDAEALLREQRISALEFLASFWLGDVDIATHRPEVSALALATAARRIATSLGPDTWKLIRAIAPLAHPTDSTWASLINLIDIYSGSENARLFSTSFASPIETLEDDDATMLTALLVGKSSASRREYPMDDGSWDRLA